MEWIIVVAVVVVIPIILFPAAFVWHLNISSLYWAVKEGRLKVFTTIGRRVRIAFLIIVPVGIYGWAVWSSLGHFGWPVALAVGLVLPVVLAVPLLVWATIASGLFEVARYVLRQRVASRRAMSRMAEEPVAR